MKRVVTSVAVLLAVIALMFRNRAERRAQPCPPTSARTEPEFLRRFRSLVAGEAIGRVLEIGVGTGANFPYYQRAGQIVAVEPDPFMLGRAKPKPRWNLHGIPASLCESHLGLGIEGLRRVVDTPLSTSAIYPSTQEECVAFVESQRRAMESRFSGPGLCTATEPSQHILMGL